MMEWRGLVNAVLYSVQFERALDEQAAERMARLLVENPLLDLTPQEEYAALGAALCSGEQLTGDIPQPHGEWAVREFLTMLADRLDALRPWPEIPFRRLDVSEWDRFGRARPIARVRVWYIDAQARLRKGFDHLDTGRDVLLLRLGSGTEVALVTPWWTGSDDLALLLNSPDLSADRALGEFMNATGFGPDEVTPLT